MRNLDREAGRAIDLRRKALAEAVVARQYDLQPELRQRYGEPGRARCVRDTEYHLAFLSAALWASSPVEVAHTGPAGVAAALRFRPQVVLCDIGLPGGMDGYAVARALRREEVLGSAYLVALTGYGREEDLRLAREAGFDLYLTKPVDFNDLQQALAALPERE
jgi:CheY-like chemotaxis protein